MHMKRTTGQLKAQAREVLKGKYSIVIAAYLFIVAITVIISAVTTALFGSDTVFSYIMSQFFTLVVGLITSVITVGMYKIFLDISRGHEVKLSDMFCMFQKHPDRVILVSLVMTVVQMIFTIPALVVNYDAYVKNYSQTELTWRILLMSVLMLLGIVISGLITLPFTFSYYLLVDDEEMEAVPALKESIRLMKGNYGRYIYMVLSFVGLYILGVISCGVALLWVIPYVTMTEVEFYRDVQGELDQKQDVSSYGEKSDDIYNYGGEA